MRACTKTTLGGIRRIRRGGCVAIGPLARNRPSDPNASNAPQSPKALTEAEAIRLAQAGDAAAFEFLYGLHSRRVYALCLRMVSNPSDAEDLMQEAFLQLFRKIGTFRSESAFSTWLHRMTVNVVLMRLRKKTLPVSSLEETTEPDEEGGGPRKDVGAPDLRLSGAVDRVNLERASWVVRSEIRNRSYTRREPGCAICSRKKFGSRRAKNGMQRKRRRETAIELQ